MGNLTAVSFQLEHQNYMPVDARVGTVISLSALAPTIEPTHYGNYILLEQGVEDVHFGETIDPGFTASLHNVATNDITVHNRGGWTLPPDTSVVIQKTTAGWHVPGSPGLTAEAITDGLGYVPYDEQGGTIYGDVSVDGSVDIAGPQESNPGAKLYVSRTPNSPNPWPGLAGAFHNTQQPNATASNVESLRVRADIEEGKQATELWGSTIEALPQPGSSGDQVIAVRAVAQNNGVVDSIYAARLQSRNRGFNPNFYDTSFDGVSARKIVGLGFEFMGATGDGVTTPDVFRMIEMRGTDVNGISAGPDTHAVYDTTGLGWFTNSDVTLGSSALYFEGPAGETHTLGFTNGTFGVPAPGNNTELLFNNQGVVGASTSLLFDGTALSAPQLKLSQTPTSSPTTTTLLSRDSTTGEVVETPAENFIYDNLDEFQFINSKADLPADRQLSYSPTGDHSGIRYHVFIEKTDDLFEFTLPADLNAGWNAHVRLIGSGSIAIMAGAGTSVTSENGEVAPTETPITAGVIPYKYGMVSVYHLGGNHWLIEGDLT